MVWFPAASISARVGGRSSAALPPADTSEAEDGDETAAGAEDTALGRGDVGRGDWSSYGTPPLMIPTIKKHAENDAAVKRDKRSMSHP
jgi:hypothetical protein